MTWTEGDQWLLTVDLPPGRHHFKVVIAKPSSGCFDWEAGPNRTLQVPTPEAAARGAFTVVCEWGKTASSLETLPEEELALGDELPGTESDEPALRAEDLTAEPYSANGDEGESPVSMVGKATAEGRPASKQEQPVSPGPGQRGKAAAATAQAAGAPVRVVRKSAAAKGPTAGATKGPTEPGAGSGKGRGRPAAEARVATEGRLAAQARTPAAPEPDAAAGSGPAQASPHVQGSRASTAPAEQGVAPPPAVDKKARAPAPAASKEEQAPAPAASKEKRAPAPAASKEERAPDPAASKQERAPDPAASKQERAPAAAAGTEGQHAPVKMDAGDFPSQTPMGEGSDAALHGTPAGGLKPSTEAAGKKELQQSALIGRSLSSNGSSDDDEDDYGPPSGGSLSTKASPSAEPSPSSEATPNSKATPSTEPSPSSKSSSSVKASPGSKASPSAEPSPSSKPGPSSKANPSPPKQVEEQRLEDPSGSTLAAVGAADPPAGLLLAATAAGLAALPVVVWSEWVLKTTGCGLPPGPSGLLGAAEGVSYLVVGSIALWSLARKLRTGSGLPAGPAGALGAVEGGSWLAVLAGAAVLVVQWQTYGYIPSALPDSNCFGGEATSSKVSPGQRPSPVDAAGGSQQPATAPEPGPLSISRQIGKTFGGTLRLSGDGFSLPMGNLLFSAAEGVLSQSGTIIEAAEAAAAAMAAAAAGQPPPEAVAAAVQHLQGRVLQLEQLAGALASRLGDGEAARQASQAVPPPAVQHQAPQPEPLTFQPPRHKVRAAMKSSWAALQQNEKLRAMLEPYPLPAVARQAAAAAGGAIEAVEHAAEASVEAVGQQEARALAFGQRAVSSALSTAQQRGEGLRHAAADAGSHLRAALPPQLRSLLPGEPAAPGAQQQAPQAAAAMAAAPGTLRATGSAASPVKPPPGSAPGTPVKPAPGGAPAKTVPGLAAASKAAAGKGAPVDAAAATSSKPGKAVMSAEMFAGVLDDLKEGYAGLWRSTLEFDPRTAAHAVQQRIHDGRLQAAAAQSKAAGAASKAAGSSKAASAVSTKAAATGSNKAAGPSSTTPVVAGSSKTGTSSKAATAGSTTPAVAASSKVSASSKAATAGSNSPTTNTKPAAAGSSPSSTLGSKIAASPSSSSGSSGKAVTTPKPTIPSAA
ncbi:hypothetical protein ABPG77_004210 [Micractinium sp. CCAP 211/92]